MLLHNKLNACACQENRSYDMMSCMEIALLPKNALKIKGRLGTVIVEDSTELSVEGHSLVVTGPGEYEVAGIKISSINHHGDLVHVIRVDGAEVVVGYAETLSKTQEKLNECHILVVNTTQDGSSQGAVTALGPKAVLLYGNKAAEQVKALGKEEIKSVSKYVTTVDKLPADLEIVVLS